jgi:uncharacterized membrane protein YeaQ/YmgE (transglycosylase-associated protein family)
VLPRDPAWNAPRRPAAAMAGGCIQGGYGQKGFIWAIIIGFVAGAIAKWIMPGRDPGGFIVTILLGIAGSVVASWLGRALGWYQGEQGARFIGSIVGAVIILAIYRMVVRNRTDYSGRGPN